MDLREVDVEKLDEMSVVQFVISVSLVIAQPRMKFVWGSHLGQELLCGSDDDRKSRYFRNMT